MRRFGKNNMRLEPREIWPYLRTMHYLARFSALFFCGFGLAFPLLAETLAEEVTAREGAKGEVSLELDETPLDRSPGAPVLTSYADALEPIRAAVVSVFSTTVVADRSTDFRRRPSPQLEPLPHDFWGEPEGRRHRREREMEGLGSGVILTSDGYILTNNHVIEGADQIRVALSNREEHDASVVGTDPRTDIAILKIDAEDLPYAIIADSDQIRVGDIVFALGNPLGVGQTVTMGIVSATGRSQMRILGEDGLENFIQTDAAINRGNSGGALVDAMGRVVGINTAIISGTGGSIGIGFAIPINMASNVMQSIIRSGRVARGFLGVTLQTDERFTQDMRDRLGVPAGRGAMVTEVQRGLAAEGGGMRRGDVIVEVDGEPIFDARTLRLQISQYQPGQEVDILVVRGGEEISLTVALGDREAAEEEAEELAVAENELLPGIQVFPLDDEWREHYSLDDNLRGLVVTRVLEESPHSEFFKEGSVIIEINQKEVSSLETAKEALRNGRNMFLKNHQGSHRYQALVLRN